MLSDALLGALRGQDPAAVASVYPWMLMGIVKALPEGVKASPDLQAHVIELFGALGVKPDATPEEFEQAVAKWPPADPALLATLTGILREHASTAAGDSAVRAAAAAAAVLGSSVVRGAVERTAPAPAGAVAAGPLARFAVNTVKPTKPNDR